MTARYRPGMKWWLVAVAALAARLSCRHADRDRVRIATFNIEHFPKDARQIEGAFDEIAATGASIVAAQEIRSPAVFLAAARRRLAPSWEFVHDHYRVENHHHIGVLFDRRAWRFVSSKVHDDTLHGPLDLPVFEVRLAPIDGGEIARILVVHLRPLTAGRPIRVRQHQAIAKLAAAARDSGERVAVLGDFNATEDSDRDDLADLARAARLVWATRSLPCTAFWRRDDGCPRSRLDHVLTSESPARVVAAGACATDGCDRQDRCPMYAEQVSDHCPVVVDL
jgi:endonuclease/exonuclease/phosphatase family metal-dependent hydrolase